jgi:hypothetical protein
VLLAYRRSLPCLELLERLLAHPEELLEGLIVQMLLLTRWIDALRTACPQLF